MKLRPGLSRRFPLDPSRISRAVVDSERILGLSSISTMVKLLALLVIGLVCIVVNVRGQASNRKPVIGQAFDEIVVSSDLNVRRKSKENRQAKKLLTNVPSGTTGPPGKPTENVSRLVSSDGIKISSDNRERREIARNRLLDLGIAGYLLNSQKLKK